MDAYYQSQVQSPHFSGASRQRGMGLGSFALRFGRIALPAFKKYILPTAKRVGKDFLEVAAPELMDFVGGKADIKTATKRAVTKTLKKQVGGGVKKIIKSKTLKPRSRADIFSKVKK